MGCKRSVATWHPTPIRLSSGRTSTYMQTVRVDLFMCMCVCVSLYPQDLSTLQCDVCILVFSVTDRRSFHRTAQLRLLLRESQPHTPIILVGNKSDLVRSREISSEGKYSVCNVYLPYVYPSPWTAIVQPKLSNHIGLSGLSTSSYWFICNLKRGTQYFNYG